MMGSAFIPRPLADAWRGTGLTGRLAVGLLFILAFTLLWERAGDVFGSAMPWPLTGLVAAAGWARLGLSIRPMATLVLLGFAFDAVTLAPFGVFPIVFLTTYAMLAFSGVVIGGEMDPLTGTLLPHIGIAAGVIVLWVFASMLAVGPAEVLPLLLVWILCSLLYLLFEGLFDLESAKTAATGS
ncbi:MAG: hypothetical protein AAGJ32_06230 [Pseudomonadota bacterium]